MLVCIVVCRVPQVVNRRRRRGCTQLTDSEGGWADDGSAVQEPDLDLDDKHRCLLFLLLPLRFRHHELLALHDGETRHRQRNSHPGSHLQRTLEKVRPRP